MTPPDADACWAKGCAMTDTTTVTGSSVQTLLPDSCWPSPNSLRQANT